MSEEFSSRPRPIADPALPAALREELLNEAVSDHAEEPRRRGEAATRDQRLREGVIQLLGAGFTLFLTLLAGGWYLAMVVATVTVVAFSISLLIREDVNPATRVAGAAAGSATLLTAPLWLFELTPESPAMFVPWLFFGGLVSLVATDTVICRVERPAEEPRRREVLLAEDFTDADAEYVAAIQHTIDQVAEAGRVLGEALDTDQALAVLREQEWQVASVLARQRELRRAHLRRWQRAATPRVREALKPQREALYRVEEAVRRRVEAITAYGRLVEEAVESHREWEQCQEAEETTAAYVDHLAAAQGLAAQGDPVRDISTAARAARQVRDERVRQLRDAGRLLSDAGALGSS